ncbi:SDR family NAD(P)-dependent oxidoreductase [Sphingomonas oryzagri]
MMGDFSGKVGIITGAGSGIGAATAERLAKGGATLLLGDVDEAAVTRTAEAIAREYSTVVEPMKLDVSDPEACQEIVEQAMRRFGKLSMAFNNAGIAGATPVKLADHDLASFRKVMSVNVEGVFLGMLYQIPAMIASGGGSIVNTASVLGAVGAEGVVPYVTSKHAVVGMTKAAALDYASAGIRINALGPGPVRTPILDTYNEEQMAAAIGTVPAGRLGLTSEIADTVAFLLSDAASFTTGAFYLADGGYTAR